MSSEAEEKKSTQRRFLVAGDVCGKFNLLFSKVKGIVESHGPFDALFAVGRFFGPSTEEDEQWLTGDEAIPLPTYFIVGADGSSHADELPADGKVICHNLEYLGHGGVRTIAGVTVAYLSGIYDASVYSVAGDSTPGAYTKTGVTRLIKNILGRHKDQVDILLTSEWPKDVLTKISSFEGGSVGIRELVKHVVPRYHMVGTEGLFYQRPPYQTEGSKHATRLIGLGKVDKTAQKSRKFLYALAITPSSLLTPAELEAAAKDVTENPFALRKRMRESGEDPSAKRKFGYGEGAIDKRTDPECWFCIDSPKCEKHMIIHQSDLAYLALAKGGLVDHHFLVVPSYHVFSSDLLPPPVKKAVDGYLRAVKKFYAASGSAMVVYERNIAVGKGPVHMHLQVVPIPKDRAGEVEQAFCRAAAMRDMTVEHVAKGATLPPEFFMFTLPDGTQLIHKRDNIYQKFDMQFGRQVLANLLGMPDRVDWKRCVLGDLECSRLATSVREKITPLL